MPCSISNHPFARWVFFFFFSTLCSISFSDPRITEASLYCGNSTTPSGSNNFISGFVRNMESLSQLISSHQWGVSSVNSTPPMYGLAQCFDDLSSTDCILCYAAIRTKIPSCLPSTSARIYLDGCFLRYESYVFYDQSVDLVRDSRNCTPTVQSISSNSTAPDFAEIVEQAISGATALASGGGGGFGVAEAKGAAETVYAMAQCWKTVSKEGCRACLQKAGDETRGCVPKREGRGLNAGCYLRYSTVKFYDEGANNNSGGIACSMPDESILKT